MATKLGFDDFCGRVCHYRENCNYKYSVCPAKQYVAFMNIVKQGDE